MDSIPSTFTIEIGGKPVANVEKDAEDGSQAKLGAVPAIFSLKNSRLQSGDWIMGRNQVENRSYLPKRVSWYKANAENEKLVQLVTAKKEGESYQLIFKSMFPRSMCANINMSIVDTDAAYRCEVDGRQ